jgi:tetratricopeptide (TPR) repeat protein
MRKAQATRKESVLPWIYNPWLDLIVGCGAWSAPLLLLSYSSLSSSTRIWSVAFYALALFFNYPHYMATLYRVYRQSEEVEKYRIFTVHITALVVLTLLLAHSWARLLPWIFTLYLTWSPWHYSGQNYGLFMMFARRAGADPDKKTRSALYGSFVVSYIILFLGFHTGASNDPLFLSLGIPAIVSRWEQIVLIAAFIVLSTYALSRLARQTGWRTLIPSLTLFSSQVLWFLLPATISLVRRLELPQSRYSTGILAVMHSAQYLWITSYYARREVTSAAGASDKQRWRPFAYFGILVLGGIALFVPGPWLASRAFHHDFTASFLIFTSLVNIHHFILDGVIWKLGDGKIAALLLNSRGRIADAAAATGGHFNTGWRWFTGASVAARMVRVSAVVLLLVWGSVDQVRYYFSLQSDDLRDLQRAASLNSYDSPLQIRLARRELADGRTQQAETALKRAVQTNPADPAARQSLLRFLIEHKRYDEALTVTQAALKDFPVDANLLVDRGLLEVQQGHSDAALADWNRALLVDRRQWLPHLYLAQELDREGEAQAAALHYAAFLDKIGQQKPLDRPAPDLVVGIVLRMADCQSRSMQPDLAIKSYQLGAKLAVQTSNAKLESLADVNQAELLAKAGNVAEALRLYQRALQLDDIVGDSQASSLDWFSYARFLDQAGFPSRFAYASMAKSESLEQLVKRPVLPPTAETTRKHIEEQLADNDMAAIRSNLDQSTREALAVRR